MEFPASIWRPRKGSVCWPLMPLSPIPFMRRRDFLAWRAMPLYELGLADKESSPTTIWGENGRRQPTFPGASKRLGHMIFSVLNVVRGCFGLTNRKDSTEGSFQNFAEKFLFLRRQFSALRCQIENVDGLLAFRIDQCHIDIAALAGQRGTHF